MKVKEVKLLINDHGSYKIEVIEGNEWCRVYFNDVFVAMVVGEDEARKVIWQDLVANGEDIEYLTDDFFEKEGE